MLNNVQHQADIDAILSHKKDLGWDYWTTSDKRLLKGAPFSALESTHFLLELGMSPQEPVLQKTAELFFEAWQEDGRFKVYPKGKIHPCQTILAAELLVKMGYVTDSRIQQALTYLLNSRFTDGGWRCDQYYYGKGPETNHSNPLPTLNALEIFRYTEYRDTPLLIPAIELLLSHWETKLPLGPCHYGIGTLFNQIEYPFRGYNLFKYVYTLSFYEFARKDERFMDAFHALQSKTLNGQILVERVVPKLAKLNFCKKNHPSELATQHFKTILNNLGL